MLRTEVIEEKGISCFNNSSYQCMKEIRKWASYCINTHSLMVQSIDSLIITNFIFMIRMDKRLAFVFLRSNCTMIYTLNGSVPDYSQILRGNKQEIVRFS